MKKILAGLFACLMAVSFAFPAVSSAQSIDELLSKISALQKQLEQLRAQVEGRATHEVSTPSAIPSAVPPGLYKDFFDEDRSDDEIVQLSNLRIESVVLGSQTEVGSGITRAIISVVSDFGGGCRKFESEGGASATCPLLPSVLYRIKVTNETVLLLRTRQRAALEEFEVGNLINVYGFRDPDNNAIEALIMRNLDKPAVERFIQLNNVEVIDGPSAHTPPATLRVVRKNINPCLDFSEDQKGKEFPCPLGMQVTSPVAQSQGQGESGRGVMEPMPPIALLSYEIQITGNTQLLRRDRTPLPLSEIQVGDKLNIYGVAKGGPGVIEARVVRDLSRPAEGGGSLHINVKGDLAGYVGRQLYAMFGISGGVSPYDLQVTAGDLPPGLSLTPILSSCPATPAYPGGEQPQIYCPIQNNLWQLSGTPTHAGSYKFELTAKDNAGNKTSEIYIVTVYGSTETGSMFPVSLNQKFKIAVGQTAYVPDFRSAKVKLTGIEAVACLQFYGGDCKPFVKLSVSIPNGDAGDLTIVSGGSQTFGGLTIYVGEVSLGSNVAVLSLSALGTGVHIPRYEVSPTGELVRGREYMFTGFVWEAVPNMPVYFFLRRPDGTLIREGKPSEATTNADGSARRSLPIRIPDNAPVGTYTSWVTVGDVASNKAVHNVVAGSHVPIFSAYLNQKFELRTQQTAVVQDYKQLRITVGNIPARGCPADLGSLCGLTAELTVEDPTVGTGASFYLVKGGFKEIFGATITLVDLNSSGVATLLVTTGASSSVTVLSPNGGETYRVGDMLTVRWTPGLPGISQIYLVSATRDYSSNIMATAPNTSGSFSLRIPDNFPPDSYWVKIYRLDGAAGYADSSDAPFSISPAPYSSATVFYPNGGETIYLSNPITVFFGPIPGVSHHINLWTPARSYSLSDLTGAPVIGKAGEKQSITVTVPASYNVQSGNQFKIEICATPSIGTSGSCVYSAAPFSIVSSSGGN